MATKQEVFADIENTLGLVPSFMKDLPDNVIEQEWSLFKQNEMAEGPIPLKYRELIGLAISGVTKCSYCTLFHTEMARLHGATDQEIEAVARYAKHTNGWSAYVNGMRTDYDTFSNEMRQVCENMRSRG